MEQFKNGESSLCETEIAELGSVSGKSLCHLQCHFGQDTLSWARLGAEVTGLDLSPEGIESAQTLAKDLNLSATFVQGNVLEASHIINNRFDIVFTSYGTVIWLHDLLSWARQIASLLDQGGFFYIIDFHPVAWMFDEKLEKIKYSYFNVERIVEVTEGTYADRAAELRKTCITWNHSLSEITDALIQAGLRINFLHEFGFSWFNVFENLVSRPAGGFFHREHGEKIPLMYSIKATKV
jgi:SAM-dependent methyltransferase